MANDTNTQARALTFSAIGRDFQLITLTSVIANLVTLYIVSIGTEAKLATSVVIISILIFALLSGINQMDTFKNWIDDMDDVEAKTYSGKHAKGAPFGMWKAAFSVSFLAMAAAQLYNLWV
mgnify:FL=1|jgi:hypothetical protein